MFVFDQPPPLYVPPAIIRPARKPLLASMPVPIGWSASGAVDDLSISYVTSTESGSGTTTRTFTGVSIGAVPSAGFDRYIIAGHTWKALGTPLRTLDSGTIAGNAATIAGQQTGFSASSQSNAGLMIYGPLNTGTTATIAATWSSNVGNFDCLHVARLIVDQDGSFSMTPHDTVGDFHSDPSGSIDCEAGGVIVGVSQNTNGSPTSWTGLTEHNETDVDSGDTSTVAHDAFATQQTGLSVQASMTTEANSAMFVASWSKG